MVLGDLTDFGCVVSRQPSATTRVSSLLAEWHKLTYLMWTCHKILPFLYGVRALRMYFQNWGWGVFTDTVITQYQPKSTSIEWCQQLLNWDCTSNSVWSCAYVICRQWQCTCEFVHCATNFSLSKFMCWLHAQQFGESSSRFMSLYLKIISLSRVVGSDEQRLVDPGSRSRDPGSRSRVVNLCRLKWDENEIWMWGNHQ